MNRRKTDYTKYSKEELIAEITELKKRKKYGLVWDEEREPEKVVTQCKKELPVLKEVKTKAINNDPDKPTHILIEGDNYHALSVLNYTHQNAIDVIYIDPPFNTGARDWKYNNNYVDDTDVFRHSKWLSFMKNRLDISKNLLADDGVIIIAIDDNELNTLSLLVSEIFPNKIQNTVTIVNNPHGVSRSGFSRCHEYALFLLNPGQVINKKPAPEDLRNINLRRSGNNSLRADSPTMFYPIIVNKKSLKIMSVGDMPNNNFHPKGQTIEKDDYFEIWPIDDSNIEKNWYYSKKRVSENGNSELQIKWVKERLYPYFKHSNESKQTYKSIWTEKIYDAGAYGSTLVKNITKNNFPFPKSIFTIRDCLKAVIKKQDAVVLDYFTGSGTTGHALLDINENEDSKHQFILVTNNENEIMDEVCYPRIKGIIEGYEFIGHENEVLFEEKINLTKLRKAGEIYEAYSDTRINNEGSYDKLKGEFKDNTLKLFGIKKYEGFKDGFGGNLKYFKTSFVPAKTTDRNKEKLTKQSIEMLCLKENTFDSVTNSDNIKIFKNNDHYTGILLDEQEIPEFKKQIKDFDLSISVYVFSLGDDDFAEEFSDIQDKVKVCSIPAAILRVYKRIFR